MLTPGLEQNLVQFGTFTAVKNVPNVTTEVQTDHSRAPIIYNIGQDPSEKLRLPTKSDRRRVKNRIKLYLCNKLKNNSQVTE